MFGRDASNAWRIMFGAMLFGLFMFAVMGAGVVGAILFLIVRGAIEVFA